MFATILGVSLRGLLFTVTGSCFATARRLHDIHHRSLNDQGRLDRNFGIGFFFFDRLFRTISQRHRTFNCKGYYAALERHGLEQEELLSLRSCSQALFHKHDSQTKA
jgi:sterol desaturase/sphingolipid hydroxylase (fatty acid hydroxylase superfamily)